MAGTLTVIKVNGNTNFQHLKVNIDPFKQYILVSGIFYPDDHNNNQLSGSFHKYVQSYVKKIIQSQKGNDFIIYDVNILEGTITKTEYFANSSPKKSTLTLYKKHLDITIEDGNYGVYDESTVQSLEAI